MSRRKRNGPRRRPLDVLHEDEDWLAVDKPSGVPVHGGAGRTGPSVLERLREERGLELHLVHRLDRGTAGVLLLAKRPERARAASDAWPEVEKRYWALAGGRLVGGVIDRPLRDPDGRAKAARTLVQRVEPLRLGPLEASLAEVRLETGRLHQIRRHLAGSGHPVLMDDRHGDFDLNRRFADAVRERGLPRPKHLMLRCAGLRPPAGLGLPPLEAPWPRPWLRLLEAVGGFPTL